MTPQSLNVIGLSMDIVGAVLLYFFCLPAELTKEGREIITMKKKADSPTTIQARWYEGFSKAGILLLIAGFILQLIGNLI